MYESIVWMPVPELEGYYEVNNLGLVRATPGINQNFTGHKSYRNGGVLKPKMNDEGYLSVVLTKAGRRYEWRINVLVATVYIPNPDNLPQVDHRNGVPWDNRVENLRWCTASQNVNYNYGRAILDNQRVVIQKQDMEGNVLQEYESVSSVSRDGYGSRVVNRVVLGQRKHAYGFKWVRIIKEV